jgi:putative membrane protein
MLPALNAGLNATSGFLIVLGYFLIKQKAWTGHAVAMISAMITSCAFLVSYLVYHFHHGSTPYAGKGWMRAVYFSILISHTLLAAVLVPLVIRTFLPVLKSNFDRHKRRARVTFPIWLYVSVTGVVIYFMLYAR